MSLGSRTGSLFGPAAAVAVGFLAASAAAAQQPEPVGRPGPAVRVSAPATGHGAAAPAQPTYSIRAVRYGTIPNYPLSSLVPTLEGGERLDIALYVWVLQGGGRTILFDTGFHRDRWKERFDVVDFVAPDRAVAAAGIDPSEVTDLVISHAHWDHMGGIDLFADATIWIQREEYEYYTGRAWQEGGRSGGIDPADVRELVERNLAGDVRLVEGDGVEILPGVRVHTGGRHTYASQYLWVDGNPPHVLASDNCYLYRNLEGMLPVATFRPQDREASVAALWRMRELAGSPDRVIPGHDPSLEERFPTEGRVTRIR